MKLTPEEAILTVVVLQADAVREREREGEIACVRESFEKEDREVQKDVQNKRKTQTWVDFTKACMPNKNSIVNGIGQKKLHWVVPNHHMNNDFQPKIVDHLTNLFSVCQILFYTSKCISSKILSLRIRIFTIQSHLKSCGAQIANQGCHLAFLKAKSAKFGFFETVCQK